MDKPFVFGIAVEDDYFVGRKTEIQHLENNFKYGVNTILMSARRLGKTSLVNKVASNLEDKGIKIIRMDVFSCRSEYDFLNMFASSVLQQTCSKVEELQRNIHDFFSRVVPKISFSADQSQGFSLSLGITSKSHKPEEVLNLPEIIASKKGCHYIICIDEFQQVGEFPESIYVQKRMRTVWQHQKNVSYCLFGSKKNMMLSLFQKSSKPFYKFGTVMELGLIPISDWVPYLCKRFSVFGKNLPENVAAQICEKVQLYSSYVQQLAYFTLLCTRGDETTSSEVNEAFENLLDENNSFFADKTENLSTYQMNFIRAVLDGEHRDFGKSRIRDNYNLGSASNITRIKDALLKKELIEKTSEGIFIADPVLAVWLKDRMVWA